MGRIRRLITIAAVIGVLVVLAIVLYLVLEPLHRDDEDGASAALHVADTVLSAVVSLMNAYTAPDHADGSAGTIRNAHTTYTTGQRIAGPNRAMRKSGLAPR